MKLPLASIVLQGDDRLPQPTSLLVKQTIAYLQQNYAQRLTPTNGQGCRRE